MILISIQSWFVGDIISLLDFELYEVVSDTKRLEHF